MPQISISDDAHHVTEAIGDMYGEHSSWEKRNPRPLSFEASPTGDRLERRVPHLDGPMPESPLSRSLSNERSAGGANASPLGHRRRKSSLGSIHSLTSPSLTRTPSSDTATQAFPLNDIDYESSPAAVAQELSNLQAIRRMSMNVDTADPDLPSFSAIHGVPSSPPLPSADEDDAARLFWVPARLHPELAPKEFKTFVEDRVERIRGRSGEDDRLNTDGVVRQKSSTGLNRRKSMLSHTIDGAAGYTDGADLLERKRSQVIQQRDVPSETTLEELEGLVNNPANIIRQLSIDTTRQSFESGSEGSPTLEDMPILAATSVGQTLKRSIRTNYRRGSLRKGERVPGARRGTRNSQDDEAEEVPVSDLTFASLTRVQTEPTPTIVDVPLQGAGSQQSGDLGLHPSASLDNLHDARHATAPAPSSSASRGFQSRIATNGRTTAPVPGSSAAPVVPQIIETPPPEERPPIRSTLSRGPSLPERKSSHAFSRQEIKQKGEPSSNDSSIASRMNFPRQQRPPNKTLDDMANNPAPMPGTSTSTEALSFIPTFTEEKKVEKKSKDRKEKKEGSSTKAWGWFMGSEDREKEKAKEKEEKEAAKRAKAKPPKNGEPPHDVVRLDLLQTATADVQRGRESVVIDRESFRLEDERKKDTNSRKISGGDSGKKEKEHSLFSSIFGNVVKRNKADRETTSKSKSTGISSRALSPEPPPRALRADIDYNWTRFSILEERAIYRMAHIKLANPRRALYSQVLLSNFMYSYLAKVQQMHPQIQIPAFVTQKQGQKSQQQQHDRDPSDPQDQIAHSDEYAAWQLYQEVSLFSAPLNASSHHTLGN